MPQRQRPAKHRKGASVDSVVSGSNGPRGGPPTRAHIRKWIHEKAVPRLRQVVWEGHGSRLLPETSATPSIRKFLAAVPRVLAAIKEVHSLAISDGADLIKERSAPPAPRELLLSRDAHGLTPLHKAAGLGHVASVKVLLSRALDAVRATDDEGRLPLHYAAAAVGSSDAIEESKELTYHLLVEAGSDEAQTDQRGKTASHYLQHPGEIDSSRLRFIPEAPRIAQAAEETGLTDSAFWVSWRLIAPPAPGKKDGGAAGERKEPAADRPPPQEEAEPRETETSSHGGSQQHKDNEIPNLTLAEEVEASPETQGTTTTSHQSPGTQLVVDAATSTNSVLPTPLPALTSSLPSTQGEISPPLTQDNSSSPDDNTNPKSKLTPTATTPDALTGAKEESIIRQYSFDEERTHITEEAKEVSMATDTAREPPVPQVAERKDSFNGIRRAIVDDNEIQRAAQEGDIGVMVSVVLSGEGERLLGLTSPDPKTQNFLSNVPVHMEMIKSIHEAASKGRLREVQARLDRRKFAIAKEPLIGATPLHSAVLGAWLRNKTQEGRGEAASEVKAMVRYLGGRFPESINQRDRLGRTPLHYACALTQEEDKRSLYETLKKLGADPTIEDSLGHTPAFYINNPTEFPHADLLPLVEHLQGKEAATEPKTRFPSSDQSSEEQRIPATDESQESSTETDDASTKSNDHAQPIDLPVLWTEEGQYLAKSLGEPLVRGLAEVSQKRPKDPIKFLAEYLQSLVADEKAKHSPVKRVGTPARGPFSALSDSPQLTPDDTQEYNFYRKEERDEHGQTSIHVAASRTGKRGALLQLIRETGANVALRDDLYKTPRDVAVMADLQQNAHEIDSWVQMLARATPENDRSKIPEAEMAARMLKSLLLDGYDHILDATSSYADEDDEENPFPKKRNTLDVEKESSYLPIITLIKTIPIFEERREWLHSAIRAGSLEHTQEILFSESESFDETNSLVDTPPPSLPNSPSPTNTATDYQPTQKEKVKWTSMDFNQSQDSTSLPLVIGPATLAIAKNRRSRCSMHIAVLCQHLEIVRFIAQHFPQTLHVGDNVTIDWCSDDAVCHCLPSQDCISKTSVQFHLHMYQLERTPLHYAMGVESVDSLSSVLIQAGAKRVQKDLRGKQPSYYFINKSDIQKLQDEEIFRE